ncbi:MAG: hypothetical protein KKG13_02240 [Nanoarchaeota archaeon]|nr:hypothetical protein [Nanoarchaeota archaeon]
MKVISDFHIHGPHSQATSKNIDIPNLVKYAKIKGVDLLGTGDFTHPVWIKYLKDNLKEDGTGVLRNKDGFPFILQTEISLIYTQGCRGRRIHNIVLAPNFDCVDQITEELLKRGRVDYDGRPIFKIPCPEFVEMMKSVSSEVEVIPAHCLLPGTPIHSNPDIINIDRAKKGDKVLTHKGRYRNVKKTYTRPYSGSVVKIIPWYFSLGLKVTNEHPFYAIKTFKKCLWTRGVCRPVCCKVSLCKKHYFNYYKPEWVPAKDLEIGDVILYPRLRTTKNIKSLDFNEKVININKDFCRLIGYYLSEGYSNNRDAICFTFNENEEEYLLDVKNLMYKIFKLKSKKGKSHGKSTDLIFYSKNLCKFFEKRFYSGQKRNVTTKTLPHWMIELPIEKQVEILKGWWYGDKGYTSSRLLMNQMKNICIRLGIIPSIRIDSLDEHKKRGKHKIGNREIKATADNYFFSNLSFFEDSFNLLNDRCFSKFKTKRKTRHGWIDENYIYLPIRNIETESYNGEVYNLEVEEDNSYVSEFASVHNCWTPWFSLFGSKSGFDTVEECFQDQTKHIFALETGLSSDPAMNWRLSSLDKYALISNSDSHSFWPWRIGREANVFEMKDLTYRNFINVMKEKDPNSFLHTIEVSPSYGKYHLDGHRECGVCLEPKETKKVNDTCPVCKRPLTIGVLYRVEELADREEGYIPRNKIPFKTLIPLSEIIGARMGIEQLYSKRIWGVFQKLIDKFGSEYNILLNTSFDQLKQVVPEDIAKAIVDIRENKVEITPGFDGVYGYPAFDKNDVKPIVRKESTTGQKSIMDFK